MKKLLVLASLLFSLFTCSLKSQEIPEFKQKMYVDSLNRLFLNKDQPVYLWLSTTQNRDSAKLLQSKESKEYTNPLYLDTEGMNTIRTPSKVDKITRKTIYPETDIIFEVYADVVSPVSYVKLFGAKKYIKNNKTYYGKGLKVKLTASDKGSGLKNIYYSINGDSYQVYNNEIEFTEEKEITLKSFSLDNVSNVEKAKTRVFTIDLSPPTIKSSTAGNDANNVLSKNAKIVLTSTDELSGVKATYYSIDSTKPIRYSKPLQASIFSVAIIN